jgi:hypothetical protein
MFVGKQNITMIPTHMILTEHTRKAHNTNFALSLISAIAEALAGK